MTPTQASEFIKQFTKEESKKLSNLLRNTALTYNYSQSRLDEINLLVKQISEKQIMAINQIIAEAYRQEYRKTYKILGKQPLSIPESAIKILAKDTIRDLNYANEQSAISIKSIFKIAKQDIISETKISEITLNRLMEQGTFRESANDLSIEIMKEGSTAKTKLRNLDSSEINSRVARARRSLINEKKIPGYIKTKLFKRVEGKLLEGKFITIINKNGQPMTFGLDYYSGMVARTRFGDSQVQASIDVGNRLGVQLYLVSDHGTTSKICLEFENKYLSTDPNLIGKHFEGREILVFNDRSKPLYHPNCKHRLIAVPLTDEEYDFISKGKYIAS